jgi:hypothetical protein
MAVSVDADGGVGAHCGEFRTRVKALLETGAIRGRALDQAIWREFGGMAAKCCRYRSGGRAKFRGVVS